MTKEQIAGIEALKTGKMIVAAVRLGCIAAGGGEARESALCRYAEKLGLAFQVQDDILDVAGSERELGKPIGSDRGNQKATFMSLCGLAACNEMVNALTSEAMEAVAVYKESEFLCYLAQMLRERRK